MILVVGATGHLGGLVTRSLLDLGRPVRALVRSEPAARALRAAGADVVHGDLKDPDSLRAACAGVDAVVTTANSAQRGEPDTTETVDRRGNVDLVDAAVAAGVRRFVLTSALGADPASPNPFMAAKGAAEEHVRHAPIGWTVLQPNLFMDVWIPAVAGPALTGRPVVVVGAGTRRHSMVAVRDVAAYAVGALEHEAAEHRTIVIGGPTAVSWQEVFAEVEAALGRPVEVRSVARGEPVPGLDPTMSGLLTVLDTYDSPIDMTETSRAFGVAPTPMSTVVRDLVASPPGGVA